MINGFGDRGIASNGQGAVSYEYNIVGIGQSVSNATQSGTVSYIYNLTGGSSFSAVEGTGAVEFSVSIVGIGGLSIVTEGQGDARLIYNIQGIGDSSEGNPGTGLVETVRFLGNADICIVTEGTGEVDLIPSLAANYTLATQDEIRTELNKRLYQPVTVDFSGTDYEQSTSHQTLALMKDINDNWASYSDIKNGANIDWGVYDGTVLTMTMAEFATYYADTMIEWRDRADRIATKARDWAENGVNIVTLTTDSSWD